MTTLYKYRLFCNTEQAFVTLWRGDEDDVPNTCPNNTSHDIDPSSVTVIQTVRSNDVRLSAFTEGLVVPHYEARFPDRSGHDVFHKGYSFVADPEAPNGITEFEISYQQWMKMEGLFVRVGETCFEGDFETPGDILEVEIVDVLGITGLPAGTVLARFGETLQLWPKREFGRICKDVKTIPPTIALRIRYIARGLGKVLVKVEHVLRNMPQSE